jgi:hypothetical protein
MPYQQTPAAPDPGRDDIDLRGLVRLASWGAAAVCALLLAVFATRTEIGAQRLAGALGSSPATQGARLHADSSARTAELEFETRQLVAAIRSLSADRDRLLARVTVLERSLDDVTGSIPRNAPKMTRSAEPDPAPQKESLPRLDPVVQPPQAETAKPIPAPSIIGPSVVATISSPLTIPTPSPETLMQIGFSPVPMVEEENAATRTEFGLDLGGAGNLAALRNSWAVIKRSHGELLEGLHPVIAVRDGSRPGTVNLRLIVGPLVNAASAVRLCGRLANAGLSCQPAVFDGQRLALR